jgi:hypothetical protein
MPLASKSSCSADRNCSPSLVRAPFGFPAGLPETPGRKRPSSSLIGRVFSGASIGQHFFPPLRFLAMATSALVTRPPVADWAGRLSGLSPHLAIPGQAADRAWSPLALQYLRQAPGAISAGADARPPRVGWCGLWLQKVTHQLAVVKCSVPLGFDLASLRLCR